MTTLECRWLVGVHEHQQEQQTDELMLRRLEELEALIKKQTTGIQTTKPTVKMIGMDKDGNALEPHPPIQAEEMEDDDREEESEVEEDGDQMEQELSDETEQALDDSRESG